MAYELATMRSLFKNAGANGESATRRPVMLAVDASYAVFHRFFAMRRWERMSGIRGADLDPGPMSDDDLVAFADSFRQTLMSQARMYDAAEIVLMIDCPRSEIWRRDLHPAYKGTRTSPGDFAPNVFPYFHSVIVPSLAADLGMRAVSFDRAEADDVAYVLCEWARTQNTDVVVLTGDADLAQLQRDGVRVVDLKGECVLTKACKKCGCEVNAQRYLALKALQGDKGDNVPPVRARLGPKTALKVADDMSGLDEAALAQLEMNRVLVDLSRMPAAISAGIAASIEAAFHESSETS